MKRLTTAGCFAIAVGVSLAGPAAPAGLRQAPQSGLPPLDYSLGADSQPRPGVPKGTLSRHTLVFCAVGGLAVDSIGYMWASL